MLKAKNLNCSFGNKIILKDVSLEINENDFIAILGANGSGKTTLVRSLIGLLPYKGEVSLNDKNLKKYSRKEIASLIGYIPQIIDTLPAFSVKQFVSMGHYVNKKTKNSTKLELSNTVEKALELTKTNDFKSQLVSSLSGGEKQRVLLAATLVQEPKLLLLDEPSAHLDPNHEILMYEILRNLNQEKSLAICMVTHDINNAILACNRVFALKNGETVFDGSPKDFTSNDFLEKTFETKFSVFSNPKTERKAILPEFKSK